MDPTSLPTRLIRAPFTPMQREPDPLTEQVSQALLGQAVAVLEESGAWLRVRTPDEYEGWIQAAAAVEAPEGWAGPWAEVEELWANLRARPDSELPAVLPAMIGTRLPLLDRDEKWATLRGPEGAPLYTEVKRVRSLEERPARPRSRRSICATARRFLGIPYLWGGCSPWGLDCSGFVQLVLRLHGVLLQRDAGPQSRQGEPAPEPDAADLVFFGPPERPEAITHVGMMLDRERFIHALGSDRVRIDPLRGGRLEREYRFARRYLP
ncbi:MAG: NlpC/P60 family protein [Armatimonadota bacterium]